MSLQPPTVLFNPSNNLVFVPAQPAAVWHLERLGNEVPIPILRNEGANSGWGLADQLGKLFDEYDTRRSAI
ncbi:hypothetical protein [Xanthomonas citri]|uniref:hypothetical protein n=1 Tax=Xanthomonas citri TaxID=346 RepID=UPI002AAF2587|nr:hypothetical protein [Xanthomonas citri]